MLNNLFFKKNLKAIIVALIAISAIVAVIFLRSHRTKSNETNPAFAQYIEAYTSGVISKNDVIKIQFAGCINTLHATNQAIDNDILTFSPSIKGKAYWYDERTIAFKPNESLEAGKSYQATLKLDKFLAVADDLSTFNFDFEIIKPSFKIEQYGLQAINNASLDYLKLTGTIFTADAEEGQSIEKLLNATLGDKNLRVKWLHNPASKIADFVIDSIKMADNAEQLNLVWNGGPIGADISGSEKLEIPAKGIFKVLAIKAIQAPEQYVLIQCSNPVLASQDLRGLISIGNITDASFTIEGSQIKVYAPDKLNGNYAVTVNAGIQNIVAKKLVEAISANVNFENRAPAVSIPGKGTIIPSAGKLTYPFEAINLKAVDVTIIKIYENNIPQFLQQNNPNGEQDLRRVGKPMVEKTIRLDEDKTLNLTKKNRFALDIDKLIKTEPGAIYRITIGFQKSYSLYNCKGVGVATDAGSDENEGYDDENYYEKIDGDDGFWQRYNNYYPRGFNWDQKDEPCNPSYYNRDRWVSRNVIASNIGLIAKRGNDNSVLVFATNILDTQPMEGVEIKLLDYQNQLLQTAKTDNNGEAKFDKPSKPYLLTAKKDAQRGYLKLDDGSSLPLSRFNANGDAVQSGIKGFIYTERGVYRPGDSVFVSFILEDKTKKLPTEIPVAFELYNPQGQLIKRNILFKGLNGFYVFKTKTDAGAATGNWLAKVKVGAAVFSKTVKVETIMPNRLKINLDFGKQTSLGAGQLNDGVLAVKWLFGTPAKNLKAKIDATLSTTKTSFKNFNNYVFDDPTNPFTTESKNVFEGNLNQNGAASIKATLSTTANAPGILQANFSTKVFEAGGNFSIDNFSMPYHIYTSYIGLRTPEGDKLSGMLLSGQNHKIEIANVNTDGKLLAGKQNVEVELYKIEWRWWWDAGNEGLSNFTQNNYNQLLQKQNVTLNNGKGNWNLYIDGQEWGRYLIRIKDLASGHITGKTLYLDYAGWAQREQQNNPTDAAMLSFTADKEKYKVGEEVTLTVPGSKNGRCLISIETGSHVLKTWWTNTQQGPNKITFKVDKEMAPNVFVNLTLLQPHSQTVNDLPIRMYGLIPILVEDPQTILKPIITMASVIQPETNNTIVVSEANGKAMTYTIALVDDGLLDLTRYQTPNPHSSFYAREALGVKTWDLFDNVVGAWGGDLMRILSIGGDGSINRNVNPAKANRFKAVVKYMGPFTLSAGQKAAHTFKLPQYIGSVRAMVVAGADGAYGQAEKTVEVKKPLMLLATLPRVAGPSESFKLPITIFAMDKSSRNVSLSIQTNNLLQASNQKQNIVFSQNSEMMAFADITVGNATGIAKIKIIAQSGKHKAVYDVEMDIRNPNPYITKVDGAQILGGKNWSASFVPIGIAGSNSAQLEVSSIPAINLSKRLNYLIQYPHGCIEQTVSAVYPQLVLNQLTDVTGTQKAQIERNIKTALVKLRSFQTNEGGFGYWPGDSKADEWGSNYAGNFLLEAQNLGYSLPPTMLAQWQNYERNKANAYMPTSDNFYGGDLAQAYRLYVLALAKVPEIGAMNRLREFKYLSVAGKWRLSAAYLLIGQRAIALSLIKGLDIVVKPYQQMAYTYGSDMRDEGMILETLTQLGLKNKAAAVVNTLAAKLSQDEWYSTQTTAYALIAIAKYCGVHKNGAKINMVYSLNGDKKAVNINAFIQKIPLNFKNGKANINISNSGSNLLYVRVIRQGQSSQGVNPPIKNNTDILTIRIVYKNLKGGLINPSVLPQGTDFVAEVTINNPGKRGFYQQMALTQIFPSGWEIINTRLSDASIISGQATYTYRDMRDDRVLTYFNIAERQTLIYQVLLNAAYLGKYYLPTVSCEAMYKNNIQAMEAGKWVQVVK